MVSVASARGCRIGGRPGSHGYDASAVHLTQTRLLDRARNPEHRYNIRAHCAHERSKSAPRLCCASLSRRTLRSWQKATCSNLPVRYCFSLMHMALLQLLHGVHCNLVVKHNLVVSLPYRTSSGRQGLHLLSTPTESCCTGTTVPPKPGAQSRSSWAMQAATECSVCST